MLSEAAEFFDLIIPKSDVIVGLDLNDKARVRERRFVLPS
jgi:hypothetical protein